MFLASGFNLRSGVMLASVIGLLAGAPGSSIQNMHACHLPEEAMVITAFIRYCKTILRKAGPMSCDRVLSRRGTLNDALNF